MFEYQFFKNLQEMLTYQEPKAFIKDRVYLWILFFGLFMSETSFIVMYHKTGTAFEIPIFAITYFLVSTISLAYLMLQYGTYCVRRSERGLQLFEYLGIPIGVLLLQILYMNPGFIIEKIVCILLYLIQTTLIFIKIIYYGSISEQLAHLSIITKMFRILKLTTFAFVPLIITNHFFYASVFGSLQLISAAFFTFKFTYKWLLAEYILLTTTLFGTLSALEHVLVVTLNINYSFIGQLILLGLWIIPLYPLSFLLEIKYSQSLTQINDKKTEDDDLVDYLFIRECLFSKYRTLQISDSNKSQAILTSVSRIRGHTNPNYLNDNSFKDQTANFFKEIQEKYQNLFPLIFHDAANRFKNTNSFACLQFLVDCALDLKGPYLSYALIIYYKFIEKMKPNSSVLESCRYQALYIKITNHFRTNETQAEQIQFIDYYRKLQHFQGKLQQCIQNEFKLIEYLINDDKKSSLFPDKLLLLRHKNKSNVKQAISQCTNNQLYIKSNQFKFMFLIYGTVIQKNNQTLKMHIKRLFHSSKVVQIQIQTTAQNLVVLKGFTSGQIVKCNQTFKNNFGIGYESQLNSNISELIPSSDQRSKHAQLMIQTWKSTKQKQKQHSQYQCLLNVDRSLYDLKIKALERYQINTRIYYEQKNGFNYVCELTKIQKDGKIKMFQKQYEKLEALGYQVSTQQNQRIFQLQEVCLVYELKDIEMSQMGQEYSARLGGQVTRKQTNIAQTYLQEKVIIIQKETMLKR